MATTQLAFRLPDEDVQAIDTLAKRLTAQRMGLETSRTEALIVLVRAGARALGVPHVALDTLTDGAQAPSVPDPPDETPAAPRPRRKPKG